MLIKRILVSVILVPTGLAFIVWGGAAFTGLTLLVVGLAAWEYDKMMHAGGLRSAGVFVIGGALLLTLGRALDGFQSTPWILSLLVLSSLTYHLIDYERGSAQSGTDFGVTLGGALYIGWLGAYLVSLRNLPYGMWWMLVALPSVWLADGGAFLIGTRWGRHLMCPRLSPHKTWEGYLGGIAAGLIAGMVLGWAGGLMSGSGTPVTLLRGGLLGLVLSIVTPLGDLGESMFKRQVGAKDSSSLLPGHGGIFDRIDSWLWAGVISFYIIVGFF